MVRPCFKPIEPGQPLVVDARSTGKRGPGHSGSPSHSGKPATTNPPARGLCWPWVLLLVLPPRPRFPTRMTGIKSPFHHFHPQEDDMTLILATLSSCRAIFARRDQSPLSHRLARAETRSTPVRARSSRQSSRDTAVNTARRTPADTLGGTMALEPHRENLPSLDIVAIIISCARDVACRDILCPSGTRRLPCGAQWTRHIGMPLAVNPNRARHTQQGPGPRRQLS